jgi:ribosome-associated translation inhibitor RaiA
MGSLDFYVDFNIEDQDIGNDFNLEAEQRLRDLATGHSDLIGASVSLEKIVEAESPYLYQVRIALYKRPEDFAVVEKESEPMIALNNALKALEEKVRTSREKLSQIESRRTGANEAVIQELGAEEVYATYFKGQNPEEIMSKDRTETASKLMVEEGLKQEVAYFAADQVLRVVAEKSNVQN